MLMLRYSGAIHRYLFKAVGDPEVVEELDQEFALRFLQGKFLNFDPSRGRFRNLWRASGTWLTLIAGRIRPGTSTPAWRQRLSKNRVWRNSSGNSSPVGGTNYWTGPGKRWTTTSGNAEPYHKLLRFRVDHPDSILLRWRSSSLPSWVDPSRLEVSGQALLERNKFAEILIHEVQVSLKSPTRDEIEEELGELKFLECCRPVLKKLSSTEEQN